ncbi:MAG: hypothetical protein ABEJ31_04695 [Haloarculaceae archaeon]
MNRDRLALVAGGALFAVGIAIGLDGGLADLLSVGPLVETVGHDYFLVAAVGTVALVGGLAVAGARTLDGFEQATPPDAESVPSGPPLGAEIDDVLESDLRPHEHVLGRRRRAVRGRLRRAAIATVARTERCPRATARERVATGRWTDDEVAAAFLAPERVDAALVERVGDALPGTSRFRRRTHRAAQAIVERDARGERR